tara:strand:+ start:3046 stop:3606 length:561 start_codon:yes stop_codon:yes gene_type:complete
VTVPNFISVDSTLNSLIITSNFSTKKKIIVKKYLKSDNFSNDFYLILKKSAIQIHRAKLLIVNLGPGSYAGIRNILSCMKVLSMIKKIKLIGISNYDLCKIIDKKHKGSNRIILNVNKKFLDITKKSKQLEKKQFDSLLRKKKIVSNYEYNGIFKNNLILFKYTHKEIELLIKQKLTIKKNLTPNY